MTIRRTIPALAIAGLLGAALFPLRADPSDDEVRSLKAAEQALKEGAFDLASDRAAALLKKYPKSELAPQAELIEAQALYQVGRSDALLAALNLSANQMKPREWADTVYWQAQALLDLGRWPEAEQKFRALVALKDDNDHANDAQLGLAWALFKQGKEADALALIDSLIKSRGGSATGQFAQLLQAKIELSNRQFKDAIASLSTLLNASPEKAVAYEANYWLGETYAANNQPDKAAAAYQVITGDPQAFPRWLVARAWLGLGRAQHALQQNDQAMLAYQQTYQLTENPATQLEAFRAYLNCAKDSNQLPDAVTKLQDFAKSSDAAAPAALLAIGTALADTLDDDRAIGVLESLLVAYPASAAIPAANAELGRLYARANRVPAAIKAFNACIASAADPELVRSARSQLGGVLLSQAHDYAGAAAQFTLISAGTDATAENASYNFLLAQADLGKSDVFLKGEADFEKRFPKSSYLKPLALAEGRLQAAANKPDDAKAAYERGIAAPGASPDQEALLNALAHLQDQTNDLAGALVTYKMLVDQFPNDSFAAQQRGILIAYELKQLTEDQVEDALVKLAQKYKDLPAAPDAYFHLGEFYMNHQDYVRAQDAFQQLITNYPNSDEVGTAYFYAGRAAFAHQDYASALALLEKVPDASPFKPDARLWEGRVYQQQQNFAQAQTMYDAVLATEKSGPLFVEASLLKGQCLFALGSQDPGNYTQALAAFSAILQSKDGSIADRNEAAVRLAKCLDKLGRTDEALGKYLDVVYGKVSGDDSASAQPPEFSWQLEAGSQAGSILEKRKDWRGAIEVYKRLEQIGGPHAQDFHDLINKLRRDNYIYE
ncbi:MAG TPA: tetratricopeptide repeat protein [Candidatus Methylacidiphilales bacterium]|jgi:tetratricopeptide (TPR) repeat protein|nr:tetratricopeptide repeat protein [Candidatus Methylacidiphilales bacterium]